MTIDLSSVEKNGIAEGNIFTPPELRIIDTTTSGSGGTPSTDSESNQNSDDTKEQNIMTPRIKEKARMDRLLLQ